MENESKSISVKSVALKQGVILGLVLIIYSVILQTLGVAQVKEFGYLSYLIIVLFIVLAHKTFKQEGNGCMSLGQGIGIGTLLSAVGALISSIYSYIYMKFIDPSFMDLIYQMQEDEMMKRGMSEDEIEKAMELTAGFMTPEIILVFGIIGLIFFSFILSLLVSLVTKKNNPEEEI